MPRGENVQAPAGLGTGIARLWSMRFQDRADAGRQLSERLRQFRNADPVVLALPRGGVPVAYEVARALHAPLDVLVVRKIGAPWQPELGVGAIAEGGVLVVDAPLVRELAIPTRQLEEIAERESVELQRRVRLYRGERPLISRSTSCRCRREFPRRYQRRPSRARHSSYRCGRWHSRGPREQGLGCLTAEHSRCRVCPRAGR